MVKYPAIPKKISFGTAIVLGCSFLCGCQNSPPIPENEAPIQSMIVDEYGLDRSIRETSGLIFHRDHLWTHNDSGNESILYQLQPATGQVVQTIELPIDAVDWEALTLDSDFIFLGDFGNNFGQRRDLRIFIYPISILEDPDRLPSRPDTIRFRYPEQTDFPGNYNHNFDAEALVAFGDSLLLFTKNWQDRHSTVYRLPKEKGNYSAQVVTTLNTEGLITDASISAQNLYLLGYNFDGTNTPFILCYTITGSQIDWSSSERYPLELDRQTEGITIDNHPFLWITAEKGRATNSSLFKLQLDH